LKGIDVIAASFILREAIGADIEELRKTQSPFIEHLDTDSLAVVTTVDV